MHKTLFLKNNKEEKYNLADKNPEKVKELMKLIEKGADAHPEHPEIWRMNAKKSAALH